MYYKIYIDEVFFINLIMDYFILRLLNEIGKKTVKRSRSILGAGIGALGISILIIFPTRVVFLKFIIAYLGIAFAMVKVGCQTRGIREILKNVLGLYFLTFLCGGVFQTLSRYTRNIFLLVSFSSYFLIQIGIKIYGYLKNRTNHICNVTLFFNGKRKEIQALYDTGNTLYDPYNHKPVSIVEENIFLELGMKDVMNADSSLKPHCIPYHSLGNPDGILWVITMEYFLLKTEDKELIIYKPMIGLIKGKITESGYFQMILNADLMEN